MRQPAAVELSTASRTARFTAKPGTADSYVWELIRAADRMRDNWAEAPEGSPLRQKLWYQLHNAAEAATMALEEGPEAAAGYTETERQRMAGLRSAVSSVEVRP